MQWLKLYSKFRPGNKKKVMHVAVFSFRRYMLKQTFLRNQLSQVVQVVVVRFTKMDLHNHNHGKSVYPELSVKDRSFAVYHLSRSVAPLFLAKPSLYSQRRRAREKKLP